MFTSYNSRLLFSSSLTVHVRDPSLKSGLGPQTGPYKGLRVSKVSNLLESWPLPSDAGVYVTPLLFSSSVFPISGEILIFYYVFWGADVQAAKMFVVGYVWLSGREFDTTSVKLTFTKYH
ncbi:hypothetical protein TNCV_436871 [Trichonephila clavipes]|nr:hypothetical protein TNCV_436871 [Trichonephila clavipes]